MSSEKKTAAIVAPVMRFIPVSDTERSVDFYRNVLGFETQRFRDEYDVGATAELQYGAARLQLCPREDGPEDESLILFLQTDDVTKLRETIMARGGNPSGLQKVNWLKMEMFEIRDPDGHTLWFGQSYDQPGLVRPRPMLRKMLPHFPVDDVPGAVAYYRDVLGFNINYAQHDIGVMDRDKVTLLLVARTEAHTEIGSCTVYIENADQLHAELVNKGANVQGAPVSRPWGLRDFSVIDAEGNMITFAQPFE